MLINDYLYGKFTIEPIFQELINSNAVQRLKHIHQNGASYLINPNWNVSRYEHSIGVMLLIRKLGGSIEEQIAGLLHDVSHTAFSHVIDTAMNNSKENYHELIFEKVVKDSDIPSILIKYGFDYKYILQDESKWTILEKPAPDLCADRIDYTLRDMFRYGYIDKNSIDNFLNSLAVIDGNIILTSISSAEWFVNTYYTEVIGFFMNPLNIYASQKLSHALRLALKNGVITLDDFLKTDNEVLSKLKNSSFNEITETLNSITPDVKLVTDNSNYHMHQINKLRVVNPYVIIDNSLIRISQISSKVKDLNESATAKSKEGVYIRVLSDV